MKQFSTAPAVDKTRPAQLRCRPGDLARVTVAWNPALVGRIVLVGELHSATEWGVTLLGEPGATLTKDRRQLKVASHMLAYDAALEPLRGDEDWARDACSTLISRSLEALRDVAPRVPLDFDKIATTFRPSEVR
ncbi:hypothetical protein [Burkholderia gladioli]|uniref:hypothetical protein n=1 Tax=Burkholderia gladioli TaxID=28095 RepID=UPI00236468E8|nr:hypothetical protein [Burkholderia gladioli]MDD1789108.1 hypothetical protein [Burkholderia gladioli]